MKEEKPFYDVNFWEDVYEKEVKLFMDFVIKKAKWLKVLESKDLFAISAPEASKAQKQINIISDELNTAYGFKIFTDEMKNCYVDSIDKIYNAYHNKNLALEIQNYHLQQQNARLLEDYLLSIDETLFWINFSIKKTEQVIELKQKA